MSSSVSTMSASPPSIIMKGYMMKQKGGIATSIATPKPGRSSLKKSSSVRILMRKSLGSNWVSRYFALYDDGRLVYRKDKPNQDDKVAAAIMAGDGNDTILCGNVGECSIDRVMPYEMTDNPNMVANSFFVTLPQNRGRTLLVTNGPGEYTKWILAFRKLTERHAKTMESLTNGGIDTASGKSGSDVAKAASKAAAKEAEEQKKRMAALLEKEKMVEKQKFEKEQREASERTAAKAAAAIAEKEQLEEKERKAAEEKAAAIAEKEQEMHEARAVMDEKEKEKLKILAFEGYDKRKEAAAMATEQEDPLAKEDEGTTVDEAFAKEKEGRNAKDDDEEAQALAEFKEQQAKKKAEEEAKEEAALQTWMAGEERKREEKAKVEDAKREAAEAKQREEEEEKAAKEAEEKAAKAAEEEARAKAKEEETAAKLAEETAAFEAKAKEAKEARAKIAEDKAAKLAEERAKRAEELKAAKAEKQRKKEEEKARLEEIARQEAEEQEFEVSRVSVSYASVKSQEGQEVSLGSFNKKTEDGAPQVSEKEIEKMKREEIKVVMKDRMLGRDERNRRINAIKEKYAGMKSSTASAGSVGGASPDVSARSLASSAASATGSAPPAVPLPAKVSPAVPAKEKASPAVPAAVAKPAAPAVAPTISRKELEDRRRKELQSIMKDKSVPRDQKKSKMEEIKAKYDALFARDEQTSKQGVADLSAKSYSERPKREVESLKKGGGVTSLKDRKAMFESGQVEDANRGRRVEDPAFLKPKSNLALHTDHLKKTSVNVDPTAWALASNGLSGSQKKKTSKLGNEYGGRFR